MLNTSQHSTERVHKTKIGKSDQAKLQRILSQIPLYKMRIHEISVFRVCRAQVEFYTRFFGLVVLYPSIIEDLEGGLFLYFIFLRRKITFKVKNRPKTSILHDFTGAQ